MSEELNAPSSTAGLTPMEATTQNLETFVTMLMLTQQVTQSPDDPTSQVLIEACARLSDPAES